MTNQPPLPLLMFASEMIQLREDNFKFSAASKGNYIFVLIYIKYLTSGSRR